MIIRHPTILGFGQYILFPLLGLTELDGYILGRPIPISVFAALYPISLVLQIVYSRLIFNRVFPNPSSAVVHFAKGAYYAAATVSILAFALSTVVTFVYNQRLIGFGVLFVGLGSLWLPIASAGAGYGKMLATPEEGVKDFLDGLQHGRVFETVAATWIAVFLKQYRLLDHFPRAALTLPSFLIFYLVGWVVLGIAGGFPFALFGILILFIYLLVEAFEVRVQVPSEKRRQISDLVAGSAPRP